ncbi:recombinase RecD [Erysipelothrix larvae]|uniref:ATP-dependent RecD2 DNA helicase n=1 Tax=Erysipelothrix larvae TaxID=1514105 RepID=A0A120JTL3_9FIRM|nr:ATP-dependent RecD-like DNA helicase [Erysipelothrix larvae]AMC93240.1 recombinase RecD [Erysipelothrix larvae]
MNVEIEGIVDSEIFFNEGNHYGVYRVVASDSNDRPITIVGNFYKLEVDSYYAFSGSFIENPRFGMQFQVESYEKKLPIKDEYIIRYLSGVSFPGIGPKTAQILVEKMGSDVLEIIKNSRDEMLEVTGVSSDKIEVIKSVLQHQTGFDESIQFLNMHGITGTLIQSILNIYGEDTRQVLEINPYRMIEEVSGIGFKTADKLGQSLLFEQDHPFRLEGYLIYVYQEVCFKDGHSFIYKEDLHNRIDISGDDFEAAYDRLLQKGILIDDEGKIYHHTQYDAEVNVARFLVDHKHKSVFELDNIDESIVRIQRRLGIVFDDNQRDAIKQVFDQSVVIITGGPGTGKSTLLSGVISIIQDELKDVSITLCAPTGRAAKRLESLTKVNAATIHSVLKWNLHTNVFGMNETNPLESDVVIVDEFSMVDIWLLYKLILAGSKVKKFVFVGDKDQLPSVGPGYVLSDLLESDGFEVIRLEHNYRQEQGSEVIDLALSFNEGIFDISHYHKDVKYFDSRYGSAKDIVVKVVNEAMDRGYSLNDIQVLSPKYAGPNGIDNLNYFLQKSCNPESMHKRFVQVGARIFREGDKILQLKNQPDDGVYNGDIGTLVEIDDDRSLIVDFDGLFVTYDKSNYINISHAYAMSVHKAQGSEYPIVILLASRDFGMMLSRKLYYTAITRSSKSVILVGDLNSFDKASKTDTQIHRNTYLKERILHLMND